MSRPKDVPGSAFRATIDEAKEEFGVAWRLATNFQHRPIRGDEREEAVRKFLRQQLPRAYAVGKGEVIDFKDTHSTQLDVLIYDASRNSPMIARSDQLLLPSEALLSVVEVKSVLTKEELTQCFFAVQQLRRLRPYSKDGRFVSANVSGAVRDTGVRCFYCIFAYESNLGLQDWLSKEWERILQVAQETSCTPDMIDRVLVLDRGLINPVFKRGKSSETNSSDTLHDWFLHLVNFLARENARRSPVDWENYSSHTRKGWQTLRP